MMRFLLLIMLVIFINIIIVRIWMTIANKIGETIGFAKFFEWLVSKIRAIFKKG